MFCQIKASLLFREMETLKKLFGKIKMNISGNGNP